MTVDDLKSIAGRWSTQDLLSAGIEFTESFSPTFDPHQDDYRVIYQASFEPVALDKPRIEFWITDTGHVAVGIETYERISRRLGRKAIRRGFAAGHEPSAASKERLQELFDTVTGGKVSIGVRTIFGHATSARLHMAPSDREHIERSGYRCSNWIFATPDRDVASTSYWLRTVLCYRPWRD
jgi:hypothetical protein